MITNFGKFCRRLRIDNGELLYDMAKKLGVSSAFMSSVENGKKKPPKEWESKIKALYTLNEEEYDELDRVFYEAQNRDSIDISKFSMSDKELMWSFARKFDTFDKNTLKKFLDSK